MNPTAGVVSLLPRGNRGGGAIVDEAGPPAADHGGREVAVGFRRHVARLGAYILGGFVLTLGMPAISADEVRDRYTIRLPGESWGISLAIPGYTVQREQTREDKTGIMMAAVHEGRKVNLSVFLEREKKPRTSERCRKKYFEASLSSPLWKSEIKRWETETLALGQYLIKVKEMLEFEQMHMHAYLGEGNVCLDLHLSKVAYEEADRPLFEEVFSSVRLERSLEQ